MTQTASILVEQLQSFCKAHRKCVLEMIYHAQSGHPGGSLSITEIMVTLFFHQLRNIDAWPDRATMRDYFVLSKGHAVPALYAICLQKGWLPEEAFITLRKHHSTLQGHPDCVRFPLVEASTGSLGQGLSIAQGIALAQRLKKSLYHTYCLIGDGEIQEGQIWEALMSASKFKLSKLCVILDYNKGQIDGHVADVMPIEPIVQKVQAFGWRVHEVWGHDIVALLEAFKLVQDEEGGQPFFIVAHTIKGKGVSFMENVASWHGNAPSLEQLKLALYEIDHAPSDQQGSSIC